MKKRYFVPFVGFYWALKGWAVEGKVDMIDAYVSGLVSFVAPAMAILVAEITILTGLCGG
jgi:hypothetical protein